MGLTKDQTCPWCGKRKRQGIRRYCYHPDCRAKYREAMGVPPKVHRSKDKDGTAPLGWSQKEWDDRVNGLAMHYSEQEDKLYRATGVKNGNIASFVADFILSLDDSKLEEYSKLRKVY